MRSPRGSNGAEPSRAERADAASRRLALLAADLGAADPEPVPDEWPPAVDDYTRVVPARRAVAPGSPDAVDDAATAEARGSGALPEVPRPGRHAARRRMAWATPSLPGIRPIGLGAPQLTVVAVVVAVSVAFTSWWVVRDQAAPSEPVAAHPPTSAEPLVTSSPVSVSDGTASAEPAGGEVTVDVTGKVRRPGIVVLDAGARVVDALNAAGGERPGVDLSTINLARVLLDGEQIVVGAPQATIAAPTTGSSATGPPVLVNLNSATQTELETLPEVGPVTAQAILAWRDEHGGFTSVDELLEVDGIGEVTLDKLAPYVTV